MALILTALFAVLDSVRHANEDRPISTQSGQAEQNIPRWIQSVGWLLALLAAFVGLSLYVSPTTFIQGVDFSVPGHRNLVLMWAARQVAVAAGIIASLVLRKPAMFWMALLMYGLMTFQDAVTKDGGLAAGSAFFCAVAALLLWRLQK